MGHRLSKIYTRTGDSGSTGLGDGSRVPKNGARIEVLGALDEVNAHLGLLLALPLPEGELRAELIRLQHRLFDLGGELCIPGHASIDASQITWLETCLDRHNHALPPLKEFILPGGTLAAAQCHVLRTVCRRAERRLVALAGQESVRPEALAFINRLSDYLFVIARVLARANGGSEVLWQPMHAS